MTRRRFTLSQRRIRAREYVPHDFPAKNDLSKVDKHSRRVIGFTRDTSKPRALESRVTLLNTPLPSASCRAPRVLRFLPRDIDTLARDLKRKSAWLRRPAWLRRKLARFRAKSTTKAADAYTHTRTFTHSCRRCHRRRKTFALSPTARGSRIVIRAYFIGNFPPLSGKLRASIARRQLESRGSYCRLAEFISRKPAAGGAASRVKSAGL